MLVRLRGVLVRHATWGDNTCFNSMALVHHFAGITAVATFHIGAFHQSFAIM
ncbi:MAG TPA: hypothetical protein VF600_01185 [Abditibacteriaceae bacterium]